MFKSIWTRVGWEQKYGLDRNALNYKLDGTLGW